MANVTAAMFVGIVQFAQCMDGARMTTEGFDSNGDLLVDTANDPGAVAAIQDALLSLGYPVTTSGVYDNVTAENVRQFKIDQNLAVPPGLAAHDGVTGPGTAGRLNALFTPVPEPVVVPPVPVPQPPALQEWARLISLRAPAPIQAAMNARFSFFGTAQVIHAIEAAHGPINLDYYPVRVEALPTDGASTMTPENLLETVRRNLSNFVDGSPNGCHFSPYDPLIDTAAWLPVFLPAFPGAVVSIDMFSSGINVDSGSVVLAEGTPDQWVFSTLWTPNDQAHPVSGNRQFGFVPGSAGEFIFFTRGADRTTGALDDLLAGTVFGAAHQLWLSFQRRLAAFVNGNGGLAVVEPAVSNRYDWPPVRDAYHRPTIDWVP